MTPREAERLWAEFETCLGEAESAIDSARRNAGRRNGYYSTAPQLDEAREHLARALLLVPRLEQAAKVLG